jgi:alpha-tubulin suppressor-like RCC1 family protein
MGAFTESTPPRLLLRNVRSVDTASGYVIAIRTNGRLYGWGINDPQILRHWGGDVITQPRRLSRIRNFTTITTGGLHYMAIDSNNRLIAWGMNSIGELGFQNAPYISSRHIRYEVFVMENVKMVDVGWAHTLAIKTDESLWAWGSNNQGQFGNGTTYSSYTPIHIMDNVIFIATLQTHTLAIKNDNTLWAWGHNQHGQLGNGTTENSYIPIQIMEDVAFAATSFTHSLAITTDGNLWAWGDNQFGQLGNGTTESSLIPVWILDGVFVTNPQNLSLAHVW